MSDKTEMEEGYTVGLEDAVKKILELLSYEDRLELIEEMKQYSIHLKRSKGY